MARANYSLRAACFVDWLDFISLELAGVDVKHLAFYPSASRISFPERIRRKSYHLSRFKTFEIISVNEKTAITGGLFCRTFLKSHGVGIADAVIAATAEAEGATLVTLNQKHFPMLSKVIVPYRKS